MKAVLVSEPHKLSIADIDRPGAPGEGWLTVRVTSGGICGSDMHIFHGTNPLATYPRIIGHEFGGVVEAGGEAQGFRKGDAVAVDPVISCGKCYACSIGRHNVCGTLQVMGVHRDGGFCEYVNVPAANAHKVCECVKPEHLSLVEPYSIGFEANDRGKVAAGDLVYVIGAGPIGLCAMQVAKFRGAKVIIGDIVPERLERARAMGADATVQTNVDDVKAKVCAFSGMGDGIPVVIDAVGFPATFEQAIDLACPAGRVVVLSLSDKPTGLAQLPITKKELTVTGSRLSRNMFPGVIAAFESGKLDYKALASHTYHYTQAAEAMEFIEKNQSIVSKVVLTF